jgi:dolichol-phosphate mannosyltransferase
VEVLHRERKAGIGPAYLAGFEYGLARGAEYLLEMDADFSHDPHDLPRLLAAVHEGADLALGSRYVQGGGVTDWGVVRRAVSRGGSLYAQVLLRVPVRDLTGGFKCFRRAVLEQLDLDGIGTDGYGFQIEMTYRALREGFHVREVPIVFRDRRVGSSKMSARIAVEAFWKVPVLRWRVR